MRYYLPFVALLITAQAVAQTAPSDARAAAAQAVNTVDMIVQVNVATPFAPKEAVGLLMVGDHMVEKPAIEIKKINDGMTVISFGYAKSEITKNTFASAMVVSESGEIAFGDMRAITGNGPKSSFYTIPQCPPDKPSAVIDSSRYGMYQMLVSYQAQRRDTYRREIEETLKGSFLEDLRKLERGFGLTRAKPIGADLSPVELIDRLSRIKATYLELSQKDAAAKKK